MFKIIAGVLGAGLIIFLVTMVSVTRIDQSERGFKYNITSGKPVSMSENPDLGFGWHLCWGLNCKIFEISSERHIWTFTADPTDPSSPFDESLTWDSKEGVSMQVGYTIQGQVTDLWRFYANFGTTEYDYSGIANISDKRIYEALRQAGDFVDVRMGEIGALRAADEIRQSPTALANQVKEEVAVYMEQFGFTVTDVVFPEEITFPGGDVIAESRNLLTKADADIQSAEQAREQAKGIANQKLADAGIEAKTILGEATREAAALKSAVSAEIARLTMLVEMSGTPDTAIDLEVARLRTEILGSGNVDHIILTDDSSIGTVFKPKPVPSNN